MGYRYEANQLKSQVAIYDATLNATVKEIKINNERTVLIVKALDNISKTSKENQEALGDLGKQVNEIPITNVCSSSAPIRTLQQWMQQQDARPATNGKK